MFRAFVFGVLATMVVALVGGYFVLRNGMIPANADATPTWLETWAAGTSLEATLRREAQDTNPVTLTDDNLIAASSFMGSTAPFATARRGEIHRHRRSQRAYTRGLHNWRQKVWRTIPKLSPFGRSSTASGGPECRHGSRRSPTSRSGALLCSSSIWTSFRPPQNRRGKMS
jgi:hypothetical protein